MCSRKAGMCRVILAAVFFYSFLLNSAFLMHSHAAIVDRVIAYVDNIAITLSDFETKFAELAGIDPDITKEEVLTAMVNRTLMMREAKKLRLEAVSEEALLKEYIDMKIKAFIRIKEEEVKQFYETNSAEFQRQEYESARDQIETYLTERELNRKLKSHIDDLRGKSCVQIQFEQDD